MLRLLNPPQEFVLTGSRFFGGNGLYSDWDFFTQDTKQIRNWLIEREFKSIGKSIYNDTHTNEVYRHQDPQIDIQLVKSISQNREAQIKLKNVLEKGMSIELLRDKRIAMILWQLALP